MSKQAKQLTQVVAYNGIIGITTPGPGETPGMLNNFGEDPNQLGIVLDAEYVQVSPEAYKLLCTIKNSGDDLGDIDCFQAADQKVVFCWLGGWLRAADPRNVEGARNTDFKLLESRVCEGLEAKAGIRRQNLAW